MAATYQYDDQSYSRVAVLGGVYANHVALETTLRDARARGAEAFFCLGDLGAFGPNPDKVFPLLVEYRMQTIRGNYDDSIVRSLAHCQCGYTDPRDNHFANLSYRYTFDNTSPRWRSWMARLPAQRRILLGARRVLMCHGSPRRMNEFLWESTTSTEFLEKLCERNQADIILATHTGIPWSRRLRAGKLFANVGVIGRPPNDGTTAVSYAMLSADGRDVTLEQVRIDYDIDSLAREMLLEGLPDEFIETILTGWWTTCNEVLPDGERRTGRQ